MSRAASRERVLAALQLAGERGATTEELAEPWCGGERFGGRIHEIRKKWDIETIPRQGTECCRYVLRGPRQEDEPERLLLLGKLPNGFEVFQVMR